MIKVIIIVVLALCLAGSLAWGFINYTEVGELKQAEIALQRIITEQSQRIAEAEETLRIAVQNLDMLENEIVYLKEGLRYAGEENDRLERQVRSLSESLEEYEEENERLRSLLQEYEKVPDGYYSIGTFPQHSNTYGELTEFLLRDIKLPTGYKAHIFDCSESAAYLEWALENAGFDADIAVGRTPWDPASGRHAWVIAHTKEYKVAIEATALTGEYKLLSLFTFRTPGVVYENDSLIPGWENYYEGYEQIFDNIYLAIRHGPSIKEWNWWEGYWGFK